MSTTTETSLPPEAMAQLARFGFSTLRPGQARVIHALLAGESALAVFPTGGGKSLCYQLPALLIEGLTVVVSPLIALMKDQIDFLRSRGIAAARLDSSLTFEETKATQDSLRSGATKILYVAPERFANERFVALLSDVKIGLFAIDEAHCISEWGHNFRPDYLKLADTAKALGAARVLALTATATPSVARDIQKAFAIRDENAVVTGFYRKNLELWTTPVTDAERDDVLVARLRERPPGPTIIYVTLQKTAERLAELLAGSGVPARAYHAGLSPEARTSVQDAWMASDRGVVVATIAFGMGIDKANVRYVIHYNLPKSLESYSQEIGRAGRDGLTSVTELLAATADVPVLENFACGDTPTARALEGVVQEMLGAPEVDVSLYTLGGKYDLRPLVLRTALTYLELAGALKQSTPRYAGYEARLLSPLPEILAQLKGEPATFLEALFRLGKKGRIWHAFDPEAAAQKLGSARERVVKALEYLEQRGWAELRPSDLRHRFSRLVPATEAPALAGMLAERFAAREAGELARVQQVLDLVTADECQSARLAKHFGETLDEKCGNCTHCRTGRAQVLAPRPEQAALAKDAPELVQLQALERQHPQALGEPRQVARFLCGLTSPATTQAKLSRHPLFGSLTSRRFADVLAAVALLVALLLLAGCTSTAVVGSAPGGAPIVRIPLRLSNVHVIKTSTPVLIDSGTIGDMPDLTTALAEEGVSLRSLGLVVLTHGHADHCGLAAELGRVTGAKIMLGIGDVPLASAGHNDNLVPTSFFASLLKPFITSEYPEFTPDIPVRLDRAVDLTPWGVDGKAISMPGHTAGSIVVVLSDHSAFVGDMMLGGSFGGAIRPSRPGEHYFQANLAQDHANIQKLLAMGVQKFYLGHGGPVSREDVSAAFPP